MPLSCGDAPVMGQFGAYPTKPGYLVTTKGGHLPVYRLKYWTFKDNSPPSLQLEYEPPVSVDDTAAIRSYAHAVWPAFRTYLDAAATRGAIITATNLVKVQKGIAWTSRARSFGLIASRDSLGRWIFDGETEPLPDADTVRTGIFQPDGSRFPTDVIAHLAQSGK